MAGLDELLPLRSEGGGSVIRYGPILFSIAPVAEAYNAYDRLARTYPSTKEGREGLNFSAASLLRMGKTSEAADRYIEYINRFPNGERIDTAHLNAIDTLREAGRSPEALDWVSRTRQRFTGSPTETNAIFGQLRLEISEGNWRRAVTTANELSRRSFQKGVATSPAEVAYSEGLQPGSSGASREAVNAYLAVPGGIDSYYGWLASERLGITSLMAKAFAGRRSGSAEIGSQTAGASSIVILRLIGRQFSQRPRRRESSIHVLFWRSFDRRASSDRSPNRPQARAGCYN